MASASVMKCRYIRLLYVSLMQASSASIVRQAPVNRCAMAVGRRAGGPRYATAVPTPST